MRIAMRVVPAMAIISPANVTERSACTSDVTHCASVADCSGAAGADERLELAVDVAAVDVAAVDVAAGDVAAVDVAPASTVHVAVSASAPATSSAGERRR